MVACLQKEKVFTPGELWLDENQEQINAHGGGILFHEGSYYWVGEYKGVGKTGNKALVGVSIYSSKNLVTWKNEGIALTVVDSMGHDIEKGCILERPKIIFNEKTKKFVMWFHLELKDQGYTAARTGVAVSDNITGPYQFLRSYRPNAGVWPMNYPDSLKNMVFDDSAIAWSEEDREEIRLGKYLHRDFAQGQMSRDMTVFVDDDGKAYHIHASENNQTLHISELTDDYTDFTGRYIRVLSGESNEAPAICKRKNKYYMISSGCTGWTPNPGRSAVADSMLSEWKSLGNPFIGAEANTSFHSQSTHIIKVNGTEDQYIYMGDRWRPENAIDGRYIWLPITFETDLLKIKWSDTWKL
jgi:hypothetical protein